MKKYLLFIMAMICIASFTSCGKGEVVTPTDKYFPKVRTIIQNNCLSCHSSAGAWTGRPTAFDSDTAIAQQYMSIKAAVADPVSPVNRRMPQGGMLSAQDIDIITKWFDKGGKITD